MKRTDRSRRISITQNEEEFLNKVIGKFMQQQINKVKNTYNTIEGLDEYGLIKLKSKLMSEGGK